MENIPTKWATIAVFSPSSGTLEPAPGAFCDSQSAILRADIETRYATEGKRRVMQARKQGGS